MIKNKRKDVKEREESDIVRNVIKYSKGSEINASMYVHRNGVAMFFSNYQNYFQVRNYVQCS